MGRLRSHQHANLQVGLCTQFQRNEYVCGFLHPIVEKSIRSFRSEEQAGSNCFPELLVYVLDRSLINHGEHGEVGGVSEACELLQCLLCPGRLAIQLSNHEVYDIVCIALGADAIQVPLPLSFDVIKREQSLFKKGRKKLNGEEGIARGFLLDQCSQRDRTFWLATQRIGNQLLQVVARQGGECDVLHDGASLAYGLQLAQQRMDWAHFVITIGTNQHQMAHVRVRQQIRHQVQRGRVKPLQIVQEESKRMRLCKCVDESTEHHLEAALRLLRRKFRNRRLFPDDELQLGDEIHHKPAIRTERLANRIAPTR